MKHLSLKKKIALGCAAALLIAAGALAGIRLLQVDPAQAREIALSTAGGGEIVAQEMSREGLFSEYSYTIVNGSQWYEIELNGFGTVTELEQGSGRYAA